ncbi:MAG: ribosome maturation factor RimM, partial [Caldilineaceae bacterium]
MASAETPKTTPSAPTGGPARRSGPPRPGSGSPRPGGPTRPLPAIDVPEGYLAVGRIVGVHGIHGEIKVEPYTDFPERFAPGVVLAMGPTLEEVVVESGRPHKGHVLIALQGIRGRNAADELRGLWLFVPEDEAVELDESTFWVHDILGLNVVTDDGQPL